MAVWLIACSGGSPDATASSPATAVGTTAATVVVQPSVAVESSVAPSSSSGPDASTESVASTEPASGEPRYATEGSDVLFDQERLHTFEIDVPAASMAILDEDPAAEEYVEGSLTFDGETLPAIGVRYKGSIGSFLGCTAGPNPFDPSGLKTCTKLSIKLKVNWNDPNTTFYGVRRVQLHAQNLDDSMLHERLGYWMYGEMGVIAPRSTHARVVINGDFVGLFAMTEQVDGRFAREHFDDGTGNVYSDVWPLDQAAQPVAEPLLIDALETNGDESPNAEIMRSFAADMAAADPAQRASVLSRWTDVDAMLRQFVVDRAIRHDDGPLHWYCFAGCAPHNLFWYENPTSRQVTLIPWDLDLAFDGFANGTTGSVIAIKDAFGEITDNCAPFRFGAMFVPQQSAGCDPIVATLAAMDAEYAAIRAELLAGPMSVEVVDETIDRWMAQMEPAVAEAAATHDDAPTVEEWRAAVERLRESLAASRAGPGR